MKPQTKENNAFINSSIFSFYWNLLLYFHVYEKITALKNEAQWKTLLLFTAIFAFFSGTSYYIYNLNKSVKELKNKVQFHHYELARTLERYRHLRTGENSVEQQTLESFDYQWTGYDEGQSLPSDAQFMNEVQNTLSSYTSLPKEWFSGKKILDLGAGNGRFTYGLLSMGAEVTSVEQSKGGCTKIKQLCAKYGNQLSVIQANILTDEIPKGFDMVFCYGVVHHTGNTYKAIQVACNSVKENGKIFLMVYGYPETTEDFTELNLYENLREKSRSLSFSDKIAFLEAQFPLDQVHGYFDAVSPIENDLLRYEELVHVLAINGFRNVKNTQTNRNLHAIGEKTSSKEQALSYH